MVISAILPLLMPLQPLFFSFGEANIKAGNIDVATGINANIGINANNGTNITIIAGNNGNIGGNNGNNANNICDIISIIAANNANIGAIYANIDVNGSFAAAINAFPCNTIRKKGRYC